MKTNEFIKAINEKMEMLDMEYASRIDTNLKEDKTFEVKIIFRKIDNDNKKRKHSLIISGKTQNHCFHKIISYLNFALFTKFGF